MSSIFSDPPFRRGTTLLDREAIDLDGSTPVAGGTIAGSVKVFQDVDPVSGKRHSNRLVYCVAARYKGTAVTDASTVAGEAYVFDTANPMTEFTDKASATNGTLGRTVGVLDEYLTGELRQNDIVWLVVKGPTSVKRTATAIAAGSPVQLAAQASGVNLGQVVVQASTGIAIAQQIGDGGDTAASVTKVRVNMLSNAI